MLELIHKRSIDSFFSAPSVQSLIEAKFKSFIDIKQKLTNER